jgi:tripeptidyl-peptidase-1
MPLNTRTATDAYSLPAHIIPHVELVTPTIDFNNPVLGKRASLTQPHIPLGEPGAGTVNPVFTHSVKNVLDDLSTCNAHITPACLRALYDFVYVPLVPQKNSYAIVEYTPQAYVPEDLDMFATNFTSLGKNKSLVGKRPIFESVAGGAYKNSWPPRWGLIEIPQVSFSPPIPASGSMASQISISSTP